MPSSHVIIPARGGSKRIPKKNIRKINGVPLIELTIKNLIKAAVFESICVSTDSEEIRDISLRCGASCISLRPKDISDDFTPTLEVIQFEIENQTSLNETDAVLCVYPTSALIAPDIYRSAVETYWKKVPPLAFLVSVAKYSHPIQRSMTLDPDSRIYLNHPKHAQTRTQDLPPNYFDAGQFYIGSKTNWRQSKSIFDYAYGFQIPTYSFVDIDQPEDLEELRQRLKHN